MEKFWEYLIAEEKAPGTVEKYLRDVKQFLEWSEGQPLTKEVVASWRNALIDAGLTPGTVNGKLAALNCFFKMQGRSDLRAKPLKIQRRLFRDQGKELTKEEYQRLVGEAVARGNLRLALIMETICATGIRVSELRYITVEAIASGRVEVRLKGKVRVILLPPKLCRKLKRYAKQRAVFSGGIFQTRSGALMGRKQVWSEMKELCKAVNVEATKVFPHNLRHLFARCFYRASRDLACLADVLGHSSIETTRIYLITTGEEHARILENLRLIS